MTQLSHEEREFTVDSGASLHRMSKSDLIHEETGWTSKANGTATTTEQAAVYFKDLDVLITVQLLEDSPAVLSRGKIMGRTWVFLQTEGNK